MHRWDADAKLHYRTGKREREEGEEAHVFGLQTGLLILLLRTF